MQYVAQYVVFLLACSSSTRVLQENMLQNNLNTNGVVTISVYIEV